MAESLVDRFKDELRSLDTITWLEELLLETIHRPMEKIVYIFPRWIARLCHIGGADGRILP